MAEVYKSLGQSAPSATTETTLYTVPGATSSTCSTIVVCNRGGSSTTFRISHAVGGGATATKDYIYYDILIPANDTFTATIGITMGTTDKIKVYAGNANLSFNLYGIEIS
jgi:hypothetical protein